MFIDSHAHLDDEQFRTDLDAVIERAEAAGVERIINPGTGLAATRRALEIASRLGCVRAAAGISPHDVADHSQGDWEQFERLARSEPIVAIGETGLEYHYFADPDHRRLQQDAFRRQLDLASELDLPVIIHCREAHAQMKAVLAEYAHRRRLRGVMHCFSGTIDDAAAYLGLGLLISFTGVITFSNAHRVRELVRQLPIDRMLIETDAPYMAPQAVRGRRCEPAHVRAVAQQLAELHGISLDDVARVTSTNARRLFALPGADDQPEIVYPIRHSLYVNLTNQCTNRCIFCPREVEPRVMGHWLGLREEPTAEQVIEAIGDPKRYDEIVFCGFGEPTLRLEVLKQIARAVKAAGGRVRINTNGQGSLANGRDIVPELVGLVDAVCVSLNTADASQYIALCCPQHGAEAHRGVVDFIRRARELLPSIAVTALDYPGVDVDAVRKLADELRVEFRGRRYQRLG